MKVGIDSIGVAIPRRYIELADLAIARNVEPAKFTQGLGAKEMAVADPSEDTVSLAAAAGRRALAQSGLDPSQLGLLVVGTETGVDHSKPVASFVHGLLELPRAMRVYDTQHACYGGTAGLWAAVEWIASGAARGRAALVICSDIARYGIGTAGEPTQGAGAVAMIIKEDPAILAIDVGISGASSTHVHDFWRPLGHRVAEVDGHYSVQCYLDALAGAYRGWKALSNGNAEQLARICYHVPFCKMAKKAHVQVRRCDLDDAKALWDVAVEEVAAQQSFRQQVESSLSACSRIGNIYTGSLYLALAGLLDQDAAEIAGARIGMFSYGSGCTSEFFSGVVQSGALERIRTLNLAGVLAEREKIGIQEYERIMALTVPESPRPGAFAFTGVEEHRRQYAQPR
ncbi:MAG: hydroxymethylglutaryl-CoA synthase family protein [Kofleriaceae bacterium]